MIEEVLSVFDENYRGNKKLQILLLYPTYVG
jgi:hypothetical protein